MLARLFTLLVCLPALALFCAGCAGLRPNHIVVGFERDESDAETNHGKRTITITSTNKVDAHVVYDLPHE